MIEHMFDDFTDAALIDAMGEATREESADDRAAVRI